MSHCLPSSERISFILTYFTFSCYVSHALCCATRAHICGHVLFQTTGVSPSSFRSVQVPWMRSQYPLFRLVYWDVQIRFIPFSPFIPLCISTCFSSICFLSVCLPTSSVMSDSCYDGGLTRRLKICTWWRASKKRRFFFRVFLVVYLRLGEFYPVWLNFFLSPTQFFGGVLSSGTVRDLRQ